MIKPGDMVMQILSCCNEEPYRVGWVGQVLHIERCTTDCEACGDTTRGAHACVAIDEGGECMLPLSWLIKLDPPGVTTEKREEVEA